MKLKRPIRLTLSILLAIVGIFALLGTLRYLGFIFQISFDVRSLVYILVFLGGPAILVFISIIIRNLLKNKPIPKDVYIISVALSFVAAIFVLMLFYGLFKDLFGVYCSGFFGSRSSCTLSPLLILSMIILHPWSFGVTGVVSMYGIYRQVTTTKSMKQRKN